MKGIKGTRHYSIYVDNNNVWHKLIVQDGRLPYFSNYEALKEDQIFELRNTKASLSFKTKQFFYTRDFFPKTGDEVLRIAIREKFKNQIFWSDSANLHFFWKKISTSGARQELSIMAISQLELKKYLDTLALCNIKIRRISHYYCSILALISRVINEPVLVVILNDDELEILCIGNKNLLYQQTIIVEMEFLFNLDSVIQSIELAKGSIKRNFDIDVKKVIILGLKYDVLRNSYSNDVIDIEWEKFLRCDNYDLINKYPSLFGNYFLGQDFDLTPNNLRLRYVLDDVLSTVNILLMISILPGLYYLYTVYNGHKDLLKTYKETYHRVSAKQAEILNQYPDLSQKRNLELIVKLMNLTKNEKNRLDKVIFYISQTVRDKFTIEDLEINLPNPLNSNKIDEQLINSLNLSYNIKLTVKSKGDYETILQDTIKLKNDLSSRFLISDSNFNYIESVQEGTLSLSLQLK